MNYTRITSNIISNISKSIKLRNISKAVSSRVHCYSDFHAYKKTINSVNKMVMVNKMKMLKCTPVPPSQPSLNYRYGTSLGANFHLSKFRLPESGRGIG
ncbi:hypothetical protein CDAR_373001 [Caerostris darwini]|uniref:Uncharacterized protein n=1 Tax=Caerostris darwini TaxID=1538125 RepID=A0AAV4STM8_9ARAC|nr:hypothetical protein CDAR_373001 [Caerostris darwini]